MKNSLFSLNVCEESGILAVPSPKCENKFNIRAISEYMNEHGLKGPLSNEEIEPFIIRQKGYICRVVKDIKDATHWIPSFVSYDEDEVTPGEPYLLFYDQYNKEHLIQDDAKNFALTYMYHKGVFVVIEREER